MALEAFAFVVIRCDNLFLCDRTGWLLRMATQAASLGENGRLHVWIPGMGSCRTMAAFAGNAAVLMFILHFNDLSVAFSAGFGPCENRFKGGALGQGCAAVMSKFAK